MLRYLAAPIVALLVALALPGSVLAVCYSSESVPSWPVKACNGYGIYPGTATAWNQALSAWDSSSAAKFGYTGTCTGYLWMLSDTDCSSCNWYGGTYNYVSGGYSYLSIAQLNHYWLNGHSAARYKAVAVHEMGHASFMCHDAPTGPSVMFADVTTFWDSYQDPQWDNTYSFNLKYP